MKNVLAIGIGGFIGSIARYSTGVLVERIFDTHVFPHATLIVNVVGCLVIGLLGGLVEDMPVTSHALQLFLIVGLLGGFTTYSAFGYQTISLAQEGRVAFSLLNVCAHLALGLGAVWIGQLIGKQI